MQQLNPAVIDASPTKEFFIDIITRDISLIDAVKDLIDNCVDGARRLRPNGNFDGLSINVELNDKHFLIVDNCGGMSAATARSYAFRFGRTAKSPSTDGSIGRFGVGMKRALFKMGRAFEVKSTAPESHFELFVDVDDWKRLVDKDGKEIWEFEFSQLREGDENPIDSCGTTLQVTNLHPVIAAEFSSAQFMNRLVAGLEEAHESSMSNGLDIEVGTYQLKNRLATLLASRDLKPIRIERIFEGGPGREVSANVRMTIYAGVGESDFDSSGWYVICNGRQIVRADKTSLTGWQTVMGDVTTPKAHNQFARFRGYVVFESDDADALPWNTSKSSVDPESRVYQWARGEMIAALRQVIDFLNRVDAELDTDSVFFRTLLQRATAIRLSEVLLSPELVYSDDDPGNEAPRPIRISFDRPREDVDFAKEHFEVSSAKKAGERVFEYFIERERV